MQLIRRRQRGFSMIEVLAALLILSIGLLGFASLQAANLNGGGQAWMRSQATVLAADMLERLRINADEFESGTYDLAFATPLATPADCNASPCSVTQLALFDQNQWYEHLAAQLPQGTGSIARDATTTPTEAVVTVRWFEPVLQTTQTLEFRGRP